jgi:hypothetical protein
VFCGEKEECKATELVLWLWIERLEREGVGWSLSPWHGGDWLEHGFDDRSKIVSRDVVPII